MLTCRQRVQYGSLLDIDGSFNNATIDAIVTAPLNLAVDISIKWFVYVLLTKRHYRA